MRSFLKAVSLLLIAITSGCATQSALNPGGNAVTDPLAAFRAGQIRLECGTACSGRYGWSRNNIKALYSQGLWNDVATLVSEIGFKSDQAYFYLGEAAERTGHSEAAKTYFSLAIAISETPQRCNFLFNNCDGLDIPRLSKEALTRLSKSETVAARPVDRHVHLPRNVPPRQAEPPPSTLALTVSSSLPDANGVVTFAITTNSDTASLKINGDEEGGRADGRYSVRRFAQVGKNQFEVVATDRFGNTQRQTVSVSREFAQTAPTVPALNPLAVRVAKPRDAVAIVIGIEKYRSVPSADFANRDASIFVDYARRALGIPTENIRLLLDEKADSIEMLRTFRNWLPTRVNRGKTDVYVFFSGHGLPAADGRGLYFLPHEVDKDLLDRTAVTQKEVVEAIERTNPKSVTMFIDSCYSGQSRTGETLLASARPISIAAKETSNFPANFTVISASAPDQISSSSPELRHGIFSYYLMRGMEGEADANKDGQITVAEMQAYLAERVLRRAMGMNRTQQPQVVGDQTRVLVER